MAQYYGGATLGAIAGAPAGIGSRSAYDEQAVARGPRPLTAFEEVRAALDGLGMVASRASALADRIVGVTHTGQGSNTDAVMQQDGLLPQLLRDAELCRALTASISDDLARIERALP